MREVGKGISRGNFFGDTVTRVLGLEEEEAGSRAFLPLPGNHGIFLEAEEVQVGTGRGAGQHQRGKRVRKRAYASAVAEGTRAPQDRRMESPQPGHLDTQAPASGVSMCQRGRARGQAGGRGRGARLGPAEGGGEGRGRVNRIAGPAGAGLRADVQATPDPCGVPTHTAEGWAGTAAWGAPPGFQPTSAGLQLQTQR